MIQRIQSAYLLIAAIISGGLVFVFKLWENHSTQIFVKNLLVDKNNIPTIIPILFFTSAILSLTTIFLFKKRQLQFVLGRLNILINLSLLGVLIYSYLTLSGQTAVLQKGIGMFFPVIVIFLLVLANKAIKKDEDLIKSVDRLR